MKFVINVAGGTAQEFSFAGPVGDAEAVKKSLLAHLRSQQNETKVSADFTLYNDDGTVYHQESGASVRHIDCGDIFARVVSTMQAVTPSLE